MLIDELGVVGNLLYRMSAQSLFQENTRRSRIGCTDDSLGNLYFIHG